MQSSKAGPNTHSQAKQRTWLRIALLADWCGRLSTNMNITQPLFNHHADATLVRVRATYAERGQQYGNTWASCQWLKLKAVARALGVEVPDHAVRAIALGVLGDVKDQRNQGGYKDDSTVDEIAYNAVLAEEMQIALKAKNNP